MRFSKTVLLIMIATNCFSQIDVNRCFQEVREDFSPRTLQFSENYLLKNSNNENTIYLISKNNLKIFSTLNYGVVNAVIDSDEERIAISYYDKSINIYDIESTTLIKKIVCDSKANTMIFEKETLIYGLDSGLIIEYNFGTKKNKEITSHNSIVRGLLVKDNKLLSISQNGILEINNIALNYKKENQISIDRVLTAIAISPNKQLITIGTLQGDIYVLNKDFKVEKKLHPHKSIITKLDFIDNDNVLSSSFDKTLVSTSLITDASKTLYNTKDYIMTFDYKDDKIIFSCRDGLTRYYNFKCTDK